MITETIAIERCLCMIYTEYNNLDCYACYSSPKSSLEKARLPAGRNIDRRALYSASYTQAMVPNRSRLNARHFHNKANLVGTKWHVSTNGMSNVPAHHFFMQSIYERCLCLIHATIVRRLTESAVRSACLDRLGSLIIIISFEEEWVRVMFVLVVFSRVSHLWAFIGVAAWLGGVVIYFAIACVCHCFVSLMVVQPTLFFEPLCVAASMW